MFHRIISMSNFNVKSSMKKVCNLFAAATLLVAGATSASARHWGANVNAGAVASIVAGQTYVLQPAFAEAANGNCFLAGQKFTTTTSLTLDNVFVFEAAGNNTFYLKRHGLNENQYLADPSNQKLLHLRNGSCLEVRSEADH